MAAVTVNIMYRKLSGITLGITWTVITRNVEPPEPGRPR